MIIATQVFNIIFMIFGRLQKHKQKALIFVCLANLLSIVTYFLLGEVAGVFLSITALMRTIIFFIYDYKKLKPNIFVLCTLEVCFIVIAGLTWQSSTDIFMLLSVFMFSFVTWQDKMLVLRIGMVLDPVLLIIYEALVGAYVSIVGEVICLIVAIIAIIYYDIFKRTTPIVKRLIYYVKPHRKRRKLKQTLNKSNNDKRSKKSEDDEII